MFKTGVAALALGAQGAVALFNPKVCSGDAGTCATHTDEQACTGETGCSWAIEVKACDACASYTSAETCPDGGAWSWDDAKGCAWDIDVENFVVGDANPPYICHAEQRNADLPDEAARCTGDLGNSVAMDDSHNEAVIGEISDAIAGWLIIVIAVGVGIPVCICICCICCMMGIIGKKKETQVVMVQAPAPQQGPVVVA